MLHTALMQIFIIMINIMIMVIIIILIELIRRCLLSECFTQFSCKSWLLPSLVMRAPQSNRGRHWCTNPGIKKLKWFPSQWIFFKGFSLEPLIFHPRFKPRGHMCPCGMGPGPWSLIIRAGSPFCKQGFTTGGRSDLSKACLELVPTCFFSLIFSFFFLASKQGFTTGGREDLSKAC